MEIQNVLAVLGLLWVGRWVVYILLDVISALRKFVWARMGSENLERKYGGKWAIVTGCTDGIGKEYAIQLAKRHMNILLVARNEEKLNNVKKIIKEESPGVETEIVQVDFSHGRVIYPKIAAHLKDKNIGILVNNVGMNFAPPTKFREVAEDDIWNFVHVNVASVVAMTQLVLPQMLARECGAIINVGSIISSVPVNLYSATKAFVDFFSESLRWECKGTGVTIQTLRPGLVATNLTKLTKTSIIGPIPSVYVSSALPTLGYGSRTTGYWPHGLEMFVAESLSLEARRKAFSIMREGHRQDPTKKE